MGKITVGNNIYVCDDKYSWKDFTGRKLLDAKDLKDIAIFGSCFSQEIPDTKVFPDDMKGVTFICGNLDNVYIPPGNTVMGSTQRRFKVQNDLRDWEIDKDGKPVKVISEKYWIMQGFSVDPKDIPQIKLTNIQEIQKAEIINGS